MALTSRPSLLLRGGRRPWRASSASSSRGNSQHAVVVRATPPGPPSTPVHAGKISAAVTFTPPVQRRFMSTNTHGNVTRPSGAYLEEPKRETRQVCSKCSSLWSPGSVSGLGLVKKWRPFWKRTSFLCRTMMMMTTTMTEKTTPCVHSLCYAKGMYSNTKLHK